MWNLGIVRNRDGKIVNHRSLLKVLLNPLLRQLGFEIVSLTEDRKVLLPNINIRTIREGSVRKGGSNPPPSGPKPNYRPLPQKPRLFHYPLNQGDTVEKKRMWF